MLVKQKIFQKLSEGQKACSFDDWSEYLVIKP